MSELTQTELEQDALVQRQQAFRAAFDGPGGELMLKYMAMFCRAHESTFHPDPHVASKLDGRREVWLMIQEHLELSGEELWALKTVKQR